MIAFIWIVAALGLVVWSLVAWGLYRLLVLDPTWLGELGPLIDKVPFADWLDVWVPGWQQLLRFGIEITESLLGWLGGAAPWVVGVTWASGALAVLIGAGLLTWLVRWVQRSSAAPPSAPAPRR